MIFESLVFLFSIVILFRSSGVIIDNAIKISKFFEISQAAIGFLLIAVATSLPELSVSIVSSAMEEGAIAAGNVLGSNRNSAN